MPSNSAASTVMSHFRGKQPHVETIYSALLRSARRLGPVREEPKKTSIHLCRTTAFAGVAVQRAALVLTLKSATDIRSGRIRRHEQASANRWHLELRLETPAEVDAELAGWLKAAYSLA